MIKIEINAENGADARQELLELLGFTATIGGSKDPQIVFTTERKQIDTIIGDGEKTATELIQQPAAEEKKKRRTKAEIESEKLAEEESVKNAAIVEAMDASAASGASTDEVIEAGIAAGNTGSEAPPSTEATFPDLPSLQRACAILVRAGYKEDGIRLVKTIGGADSSKEVPEEKRQVLIDALIKFAEDNKIAQ